MIEFEKEVLAFLNLPSLPLKKFDGKSSFKDGVAILQLASGNEAYAVATFDNEKDEEPRVRKTFSQEQFNAVKEIFVVPSYMDTETESFDLDKESKEAAERLADEAKELENDGVDETHTQLPENEYLYDFIHNDEEAVAYITAYNKKNKIKGKIQKKHDAIVARLMVIWSEENKK